MQYTTESILNHLKAMCYKLIIISIDQISLSHAISKNIC